VTWKLWLDDVRDPTFFLRRGYAPEMNQYLRLDLKAEDFVWCKTPDEAKQAVQERGVPEFMALDHDLGYAGTVFHFLNWLAEEHPNSPPKWMSHSSNRCGVDNTNAFMDSWHRSLDEGLLE